MFTACEFTFDGASCEEYGLMLYDIGSSSQTDTAFATAEIQEEALPSQNKPFFYTVARNQPLEFNLTFGVNMERIDRGKPLTKSEISSIAKWLCRDEHRILTIEQADMEDFFYRCVITELSPTSANGVAWALTATVRCDAAYAYRTKQVYNIDASSGEGSLTINALHDNGIYYWPIVSIVPSGGGTISIQNETDNGREFRLSDLPDGVGTIVIDASRGIITSSTGVNIYPLCNFRFLRLLQGDNQIAVDGACEVEIVCEYPALIGA